MKLVNEVSTDNLLSCQTTESKWHIAIKDAENEVESLTKQTERLKEAIKTFKANIRDGVPWPGEGRNDAAAN